MAAKFVSRLKNAPGRVRRGTLLRQHLPRAQVRSTLPLRAQQRPIPLVPTKPAESVIIALTPVRPATH